MACAGILTLLPVAAATAEDTARAWTLGERGGRQVLVTPEGAPFLILGISHAGAVLHPALPDLVKTETRQLGRLHPRPSRDGARAATVRSVPRGARFA